MCFSRFQSRITCFALLLFAGPLRAQEKAQGPVSDKAKKAWAEAYDYLHRRNTVSALDSFRRADKADGGRCLACQRNIIKYGAELGDWKAAETAAAEMVGEAQGEKEAALAHFEFGRLLQAEGVARRKEEIFARAHEELQQALAAVPRFPEAVYADGLVLAHLKQDDAAKAQFEQYVKMQPQDSPQRQRAQRYIGNPALARERMAPPFAVTTLDGQRVALDDLTGKVVLIDFWATWCGPCREALPHIQKLAKKFDGEPFVILSVSLDSDESQWKDFVATHGMTWPQYWDGKFNGPVARLFAVNAIPHTFTIDADGVLEDEHIGDASIEGKLKKLIARAREAQGPLR
ncbi:MAG TPA: redoxin domain-containing protein [Methylomirabilota bacterium]|nr:redoxin domain-containing protein [Methylomirabilota bacterium]